MAKKQTFKNTFASVADYVQYVAENHRENSHAWNYDRPSFCKATAAEAVAQGVNGNPEYTTALFDAVCKVKNAGDGSQIVVRRDVDGDFFDVGDVLAGAPECWFKSEVEAAQKAVDVIFDGAAWCDASQEEINNRGAALITLIDALTAGGYAPEITLVFAFIGERKKRYAVKIHVDNKPLDIDAIAYFACNPAALRRVGIAYTEMIGNEDFFCAKVDTKYFDDEVFPEDVPTVVFPGMVHHSYNTAENARQTVQYIISKLEDGEKFIRAVC